MKKYGMLCKVLLSAFKSAKNINVKAIDYYSCINIDELENSLKSYLSVTYGYKIDYSSYLKEIKVCFENIVNNSNSRDLIDINAYVLRYTEEYINKMNQNYYSAILIESLRGLYSKNIYDTVVKNFKNQFSIGIIDKRNEDFMPYINIKDINLLEKTLKRIVFDITMLDTPFNIYIRNMNEHDGLKYLFQSIVRNASCYDLCDINSFFQKYDNFLTDDTFSEFTSEKYIGQILGNDVFVKLKKAYASYETPYYFSFYLKNSGEILELPNIRFGIDDKKVFILATQTSQENYNNKNYDKLCECYKCFIGNNKYFRNYNPMHAISIILSLGLFKRFGMDNINVVGYMPFRYKKCSIENNFSDFESNDLQYRLTNKQFYTYLRVLENFDGIFINDYSDLTGNLSLILSDDISSSNDILNDLFYMTCKPNENKNIIK